MDVKQRESDDDDLDTIPYDNLERQVYECDLPYNRVDVTGSTFIASIPVDQRQQMQAAIQGNLAPLDPDTLPREAQGAVAVLHQGDIYDRVPMRAQASPFPSEEPSGPRRPGRRNHPCTCRYCIPDANMGAQTTAFYHDSCQTCHDVFRCVPPLPSLLGMGPPVNRPCRSVRLRLSNYRLVLGPNLVFHCMLPFDLSGACVTTICISAATLASGRGTDTIATTNCCCQVKASVYCNTR
jgi:hypothetical protein